MSAHPSSYQPSGKLSLGGLFWGLLFGGLAAVVLGLLYAYLCHYNPFIYVTVIGALATGLGVGFFTWKGVKLGKLRAPWMGGLLAMITAAVALYVNWFMWVHLRLSGTKDVWPVEPDVLWRIIGIINEAGAWSIRGNTPTGALLWLVWLIEALIIVGAAALTVSFNIRNTPFCEDCNAWAEDDLDAVSLPYPADIADFRASLQDKRLDVLENLTPNEDERHLQLSLKVCVLRESVRGGYLSVDEAYYETDKKGEKKEKTDEIVKHLILDASHVKQVKKAVEQHMRTA